VAAYRDSVTTGPLTARPAAFFDLDKTIIAKSSTLALGRPLYEGGLINRRVALRTAYTQLVYSIAGADEASMDRMRRSAERMCAGWAVDQVTAIVDEALHDLIDPLIYAEAAALIDAHHAEGRDVVIVSSSGEEIVSGIGRMVGADHVIATRMVIEDGHYTGEVAFYAYGEAKADAIRELAAEAGYDLAASYAYSDSATDVPMLEAVGHPTAVNPDRALRRVAEARGWPILEFDRPVHLRSRMATVRPNRQVALAVTGTVAAAAALAWTRRRARA
jgi:HAD superfamily hydrolase (TIGR01490 family)